MLPNREAFHSLVQELASAEASIRKGLQFPDAAEARFLEPAAGYAVWEWEPPADGDRGKLTYIFDDLDGVGAFMRVTASSIGKVKEIEFWRGDGVPIQGVPKLRDLIEGQTGMIY